MSFALVGCVEAGLTDLLLELHDADLLDGAGAADGGMQVELVEAAQLGQHVEQRVVNHLLPELQAQDQLLYNQHQHTSKATFIFS